MRWSLYGVSMVVVCSHLAAHGHMNHERIASYNNILENHKYTNKQTEMILYHEWDKKKHKITRRIYIIPSF